MSYKDMDGYAVICYIGAVFPQVFYMPVCCISAYCKDMSRYVEMIAVRNRIKKYIMTILDLSQVTCTAWGPWSVSSPILLLN